MKQILLVLCATATVLAAQAYTVSENLKTYAVTQSVDSVDSIVLGTGEHGGSWDYTKDRVYDGRGLDDLSHWFEGGSDDAWAGYEVSPAKVVTRIRYLAGVDSWADRAKRMRGCSFQGANESDFSDAVTLYTIPSDMSLDDLTNGWCEVVITDSSLLSRTFKYLRFFAPSGKYGGNVAEVEVYGCDSFPSTAESAPAAPECTSFAAINGKVSYGFIAAADAHTYRFERRFSDDVEWETLDEYVYVNEDAATNVMHEVGLTGPADYRLVAVNAAGETAATIGVPYYKALTGTIIGSTAEDGSNHAGENAFDGDISTYYKSAEVGGWIGLDLGSSRSVCGIRLVPEKGQNWYCQYSKVQISDDPGFPDGATTSTEELHQSWSGGPDDGFVTLYSFEAISGRYVRFKANSGRYCGVAEIEFLTDDYAPEGAPENLSTTADADTGHAVLSWDLPSVACMTTRIVRTTAPGGGTDTVTVDIRGNVTEWADETSIAGVKYYYSVQFVNNVGGVEYAGEAATAESYVASIQIERAADDQTSLRSGMTAIASGTADASKMFDGSVESGSWPDGDKYEKVGVDLGARYVITGFRVYPRYQSDWDDSWKRLDGAVLAGSNDASWSGNATVLSVQCAIDCTEGAQWFEFNTMSTAAYRYVFLQKDSAVTSGYTSSFYGNVAELQLFGYPAAALDVLLAPEISSVQWKGSKVKLAWAAAQNATGYRIERKSNDGAWETVATVTGTEYTDASMSKPTKGTYTYRIASIGENAAVAYTLAVAPTGTPSPHGLAIFIQ